jgi:CheY-like chemotaxis protein
LIFAWFLNTVQQTTEGFGVPAKQKILVIDDHVNFLKLVEAQLVGLDGYEVHVADNGQDGLTLAIKHQPDLIILDWVMPDMDGLEVLKQLKTDPVTKRLRIFMLTTEAKMGHVTNALTIGAEGYLTKPIEMPVLSTRIAHILS